MFSAPQTRLVVEPTPLDLARVTSPAERRTRGAAPASPAPGPAHATMDLQRGAPDNLRRHLARVAARLLGLVVADLAAFGALRELYRVLGEGAALGPRVAQPIQTLLPAGYLDGW